MYNTKHINTIINDFGIYLVFLQHFENKRLQTTVQMVCHNMACYDITIVLSYNTQKFRDIYFNNMQAQFQLVLFVRAQHTQ
jgi:hypothetical protein